MVQGIQISRVLTPQFLQVQLDSFVAIITLDRRRRFVILYRNKNWIDGGDCQKVMVLAQLEDEMGPPTLNSPVCQLAACMAIQSGPLKYNTRVTMEIVRVSSDDKSET